MIHSFCSLISSHTIVLILIHALYSLSFVTSYRIINMFSYPILVDLSERLAATNLTAHDDKIVIPEMLRVSKGEILS